MEEEGLPQGGLMAVQVKDAGKSEGRAVMARIEIEGWTMSVNTGNGWTALYYLARKGC